MATFEYNINNVIGRLHDAAKAAADKKNSSFKNKLRNMFSFGDGDVLDNTGINEDSRRGSVYRGPGKYEIRFVRGGYFTENRFKDYMSEYLKWFTGEDIDITDYVDDEDEKHPRYYTVPYSFVAGRFTPVKADDVEGFEGADDTEEDKDAEGSESDKAEDPKKTLVRKILSATGDTETDPDDILKTDPSAEELAKLAGVEADEIEKILKDKDVEKAADDAGLKPDSDAIKNAAKSSSDSKDGKFEITPKQATEVFSEIKRKFPKGVNIEDAFTSGISKDFAGIEKRVGSHAAWGKIKEDEELKNASSDYLVLTLKYRNKDENFLSESFGEKRADDTIEKIEAVLKRVFKDNNVIVRSYLTKNKKDPDFRKLSVVAALSVKTEDKPETDSKEEAPKDEDPDDTDVRQAQADELERLAAAKKQNETEAPAPVKEIVKQLKERNDIKSEFIVDAVDSKAFKAELEDYNDPAEGKKVYPINWKRMLDSITANKWGIQFNSIRYGSGFDPKKRIENVLKEIKAVKDIDPELKNMKVYTFKVPYNSDDVKIWSYLTISDSIANPEEEDYGDSIDENDTDMKDKTKELVKAILENNNVKAKDCLRSILKTKVNARFGSISAKGNCK